MRELNSYYQLCNSALELSPVPGASSDTSSSPRSSTTEDDMHDVTCRTEQGACNSSKPIYNFSIPDFIKHERQTVASSADNIPLNEAAPVNDSIQISRESKRRRDQRDDVEAIESQNQTRADNRSNCRKKRRRTEQAANNHSPELIDLTDIADHEDSASVRVLDEIDPRPYLDSSIIIDTSRSQAGAQASGTTLSHAYESELERFRQRLRESRERIRREVAVVRDTLSRNRLSHQNTPCSEDQRIVSDGLAYTSQRDVDLHSNIHQTVDNQRNYEYRPSEAPVINLEEDNHVGTRNRDREVTRMIFDESLYSPPYLTPLSARQAPSLETIEESIDRFEQNRRERERNMQRIRQQTQHRINEVRNRISRLGQQINNGDSSTGDGSFRIHISDSPQDNRHVEDEVEFLRELRPLHNNNNNNNSNSSTQSAGLNENNSNSYNSNYSWNHLSRRRRFSNLFSNANITVPDFLFPYVHFISPAATQRLHHFPAPFLDDGEDYEALWNLAERLGPAKPRGLSKSEIDRLHAFRYSASKAEETNTSCVVCMSEYCLKEKIRKLPCTHDFHSKCIDKWLKSNKTCPVCRDEVKCT